MFVDLIVHELDESIEIVSRCHQAGVNNIFDGSLCYEALFDAVLHHTMTVPSITSHREVVHALAVVNAGSFVPDQGIVRSG